MFQSTLLHKAPLALLYCGRNFGKFLFLAFSSLIFRSCIVPLFHDCDSEIHMFADDITIYGSVPSPDMVTARSLK